MDELFEIINSEDYCRALDYLKDKTDRHIVIGGPTHGTLTIYFNKGNDICAMGYDKDKKIKLNPRFIDEEVSSGLKKLLGVTV